MITKKLIILAGLLTAFAGAAGAAVQLPVVTLTHTAVSVTTSSAEIIAAQSTREYLIIVNISDTRIDCKVGAAAVAGEGIPLYPTGGSFEMSPGFSNLDTRAINCIHVGSGNKVINITVGTR